MLCPYMCSETCRTETRPLGSPFSSSFQHILQLFPSPRKSQDLGVFFHFFCSEPGGGTMVRECVLVHTLTFVLSSPQPKILSCQHLDSGKTKSSSSGSPSESLHIGHTFWFFLSFLKENSATREFFLNSVSLSWCREGIWQVSATNFPTGFDVVGFILTWGARGF